jgi:hypothetical protein
MQAPKSLLEQTPGRGLMFLSHVGKIMTLVRYGLEPPPRDLRECKLAYADGLPTFWREITSGCFTELDAMHRRLCEPGRCTGAGTE